MTKETSDFYMLFSLTFSVVILQVEYFSHGRNSLFHCNSKKKKMLLSNFFPWRQISLLSCGLWTVSSLPKDDCPERRHNRVPECIQALDTKRLAHGPSHPVS